MKSIPKTKSPNRNLDRQRKYEASVYELTHLSLYENPPVFFFAFSGLLSPCRPRPRPLFPDNLDDMTRSRHPRYTHARVYKT